MFRLLLLLTLSLAVVSAFPAQNGFRPVQGARGPSITPIRRPIGKRKIRRAPAPNAAADATSNTIQFTETSAFPQQSVAVPQRNYVVPSGPDKTIYVRLPTENTPSSLPPISAGPPQKHYRIVILKTPTPPVRQPILPPKVQQKTIIYVLHQKPKLEQQVIETPSVKHPPQVLFVGYDDELTSEDLQKLAQGDHTGFTVTSQQETAAPTYSAPASS